VAGRAAFLLEDLVAVLLVGGERAGVALEVLVELRVRGEERPLVLGDRVGDRRLVDALG